MTTVFRKVQLGLRWTRRRDDRRSDTSKEIQRDNCIKSVESDNPSLPANDGSGSPFPGNERQLLDQRPGLSKPSIDILSRSSNVTMKDVIIHAQAAERIENHYHASGAGFDMRLNAALQRLPDPKGCSWDDLHTCSEGTRVEHIKEISLWAAGSTDGNTLTGKSEQVLVVGGPAGSGKSALAHTICKKMDERGLLVTSVFFSQLSHELSSQDFMAMFIRGLCSISPQVEQRIGELIIERPALASAPAIVQFRGLIIPIIPLLPSNRTYVVGIDALDEQSDRVILELLRDYVSRLPITFKFVLTTRPVPQVMQQLERQSHIHIFSRSLAGDSSFEDIRTYANVRLSKAYYREEITPELLDKFISKSEGLFLWAEAVLNHIDNSYDPLAELADIVKGASTHWAEAENATKKLDWLYEHILSKLEWTDPRFVEKYRIIMGALVTLAEPLSANGLAAMYEPDGITELDIHRICTFIRPLLQDYTRNDPQKPIRLLHLSLQEFLTQRAPAPYRVDSKANHHSLSRLSLLTIKKAFVSASVPILGYTEGDWVWDLAEIPPEIPTLSKEEVSENLWYAIRHLVEHELLGEVATDQTHSMLLYEVAVENPRFLLETSASLGAVVDIASIRKRALTLRKETLSLVDIRKTMGIYYAMARCLYALDKSLGILEEAILLYRQFSSSPSDPAADLEYALCLHNLAGLLYSRRRSHEALEVAEEALIITRRLTAANQNMAGPALGSLLLLQSLLLYRLERHEESHQVDLDAIDAFRGLQISQPGKFRTHLAMSLSWTAENLMCQSRFEEALSYIQESIEHRRSLANHDPDKYGEPLARTLIDYGFCLAQVGRAAEAVSTGEEAVEIHRRLAAKDPSRFKESLSDSLYWLAWCMSTCDRHADAVPLSLESLEIRRKLAEEDPTTYEDSLAFSLDNYAFYLSKCPGNLAESIIQPFKEAADIRRRLASEDPQRFGYNLEHLLIDLAATLDELDRPGDAAQAMKELVDIRRGPAGAASANHDVLAAYAQSLDLYSFYLSKSPITLVESNTPGLEALEIRRKLAREDPQRFDEDLAESLHSFAMQLGRCHRYGDAIPISLEGIETQRRLVERDSEVQVHDPLLAEMLNECAWDLFSSPGREHEALKLAEESVEIYRRLALKNREYSNDVAMSLDTLGVTLNRCERYEDALTPILEGLEIYHQAVEGKAYEVHDLHSGSLHKAYADSLLGLGRKDEAIVALEGAITIYQRLVASEPEDASYGLRLHDCLQLLKRLLDGAGDSK
ncbi:hypothetical protein FA15DRAFT_669240 [Coprinopsis marcescibilis]|uniref:Nephrocystin 3-like N-terminal domain-containing protein n=1 Tax=Coprinopsis marcescibilis TaxID=230819 RepID=A0A5C3L968_COPMA|nr:hypothetical protein FA15DRAFT_669240 [Coprinopsis marcescibilis]